MVRRGLQEDHAAGMPDRCPMKSFLWCSWIVLAACLLSVPSAGQQTTVPEATEGDFVVNNFQFRSGESLPELRLHYTTLGEPVRNAEGRVINAALILHATGGSGHQFLQPIFAGELFSPGQLLDA